MIEHLYFDDMWEGEVVLRDRYQLELKSLYSPLSGKEANDYSLEFYFFIPTALQINNHSYTRQQFYSDLTSLIRFKTPVFTPRELINTENPRSPISRIRSMLEKRHAFTDEIDRELKLLGNILRSTVRNYVRKYIEALSDKRHPHPAGELAAEIGSFLLDMKILCAKLREFFEFLTSGSLGEECVKHTRYVDEFFSITVEQYLTTLLSDIRGHPAPEFDDIDHKLRLLISNEIAYRTTQDYTSKLSRDQDRNREARTYRTGLLSKFVMDVLLLRVDRRELISKAQHIIGSFAAGVAMFFYLLLFAWQGNVFVINSMPFIILTTFIYVLKDRMKDILKSFSAKMATEFYPDFSTSIRTPKGDSQIGSLTESFAFMRESELPDEVRRTRLLGTTREVPEAKRLQNIIYYRRRVKLNTQRLVAGKRRFELNDIFRFNISRFLRKASDPIENHLVMDVQTGALMHVGYPKVYHINLILRQQYTGRDGLHHVDLKKIRLVVDKDGILRIERLDEDGNIVPDGVIQ
ncbi:MAG: hypothetical protein KDK78_10195 [Chlamydiia bacterium]|nr:hypothetical protein [Chlamydiia bacterium]